MQTILTKFIPATNTRGSRIKAVQYGWGDKRECKSLSIPYPHEMNSDDAHAHVAGLLAAKLGWYGEFVSGSLGAHSEYAECFVMLRNTKIRNF